MAVKYKAHPDDEQMLMEIRQQMIKARRARGWNQVTLSRLINDSTHACWGLENGDFDWHLSRLQQWMIPFDHRLQATPMFWPRDHDLVHYHPEVHVFQELWELHSQNWPMWQRAYLVAYLSKMRERLGVTRGELGARMGVTGGAIGTWEINGGNVRMLRLLNIARALGGTIELKVLTS